MYKERIKLFGSPRGNAVMKAKRVTGPTANATLRIHVALERCEVAGCESPVVVTRHPDYFTKDRACIDHVKRTKGKNVPKTRAW